MLWYMCLTALVQIGACVCPERCSCSPTSEVSCSGVTTTPRFPIYTRRISIYYQAGSEIQPLAFTGELLPYLTTIYIRGSVEVIRPFAFKGLTVNAIYFFASIKKIEYYSFFGSKVRSDLNLQGTVGSIGAFSFSHIGQSRIHITSSRIKEIKSQAFANTSSASFSWSSTVIQNLECDTIDHAAQFLQNSLSCDNSLCWLFNSSQSGLMDAYCAFPSDYRIVRDFLAQPPDSITALCGIEQSACSRSQAPPICDFTSEEVINMTCTPRKTTTLQMLTDRMTVHRTTRQMSVKTTTLRMPVETTIPNVPVETSTTTTRRMLTDWMTNESTTRQMSVKTTTPRMLVETTTPYVPVETTKQRMPVKITTLWLADKSSTQHMPVKIGTLQTSSTSPMVENSSELQDVNKCESGSFELCGRNSVCFNINGSHECRCSHSHTSSTGDGTNCTPISVKDNFAAGLGIGLGTTCLVLSSIVFVQLLRRRRRQAQNTSKVV